MGSILSASVLLLVYFIDIKLFIITIILVLFIIITTTATSTISGIIIDTK